MGCDIHFFVERRAPAGWEMVPAPRGVCPRQDEWVDKYGDQPEWYPWRSYTDFAKLAGVRDFNGGSAYIQPRGLPEDASLGVLRRWAEVFDDEDKSDAERLRSSGSPDWHNASWWTADELTLWFADDEESCVQDLVPLINSLGNPKDTRVVFWFDN